MNTIVIGGGWSGLAAAATLAANNIPVTVLEAAKQLGGRARGVPFGNEHIDNGQHLFTGSYQHTISLFNLIGIDIDDAFNQFPLALKLFDSEGEALSLAATDLPPPFHLLIGITRINQLSIRERALMLRFCAQMAFKGFQLDEDVSLEALLIRHRQTGRLKSLVWEPLCLATLNTPLRHASAELFLKVLHDGFNRDKEDCRLLVPKTPLSTLFSEHALDFIESHHGHVQLNSRVESLRVEDGKIKGVITKNGEIQADQVIIATDSETCSHLLSPIAETQSVVNCLQSMKYAPVNTVFLRYPKELNMPAPVFGLVDKLGLWVYDHQQPSVVAVTLNNHYENAPCGHDSIVQTIQEELATLFPHWPRPTESVVLEEPKANLIAHINTEHTRPANQLPLKNAWLAADYTDTQCPVGLESCVKSGVMAAEKLYERSGSTPV